MQAQKPPSRWLSGALILGAIAAAWAIERPRWGRPAAASAVAPDADPSSDPSSGPSLAQAGPGPRPGLWRRPWPWWRQVLLNTYTAINDDRLLAVAAGVVFYALLAVFPAVTAFVSFYGLFASPQTVGEHLMLLSNVLPEGGLDIIHDQVARIAADNDGRLSLAFLIGLAIALWSANAGVKAMIDALNVVEDTAEERGFVRLNAVSLTFTLGAIVFLLTAVGAVVAFPLVMSVFGLGEVVGPGAWFVRWPAMLMIVMLMLSVLYRFGPSRGRGRWRFFSPGIVFAAFAWLAGSAGLSFYLSNFADYNATYGSLGAAIGLMMWMWLTAIVILVGAELDREIDRMREPA